MSKKTTDATKIIYDRIYRSKPEREAALNEARQNAALARKLLVLRTSAGLSQEELANRVGTSPSVISRLENAEYEGHSLTMLRRIASALGKSVEVRFVAKAE